MQTEAEAFLQRIRAYPDDDAQRLIFADWLDEEGDPRGRFIRVQLALSTLPPDDPARQQLLVQERDLLAAHRDEWLAPYDKLKLASGCEFRRGFVDELKVAARQLLLHAAEIFAISPVRHIHLLDVSEGLPAVIQSPYLSRLAALTVHAQHTGEPLARAVAGSEHLADLKRLTLTRNRLDDNAIEQLARSPHLANLEELDLSENLIGETGARAIAASSHLGKLQRLELRDNRLGPVGAEAVAGSDRLASLQRLGLSRNDVGLPRLLSLSRAHALLGVPVLDLSANGLKAAALQAMFGRRQGPDDGPVRLTHLDLTYNELGDDGARVLAACPHLAGVLALRLSHCGIGDEGCRALANGPHFDRVEVLELEGNPLGDAGLRAFLDPRSWRGLRQFIIPRVANISIGIRNSIDRKLNRPRRP
jgi:uncharacterized protein (TIGR02996 family)